MISKPSAVVIKLPSTPDHWSDRHLFDHFRRCDGLSRADAIARVEKGVADELVADSLPPGEGQAAVSWPAGNEQALAALVRAMALKNKGIFPMVGWCNAPGIGSLPLHLKWFCRA